MDGVGVPEGIGPKFSCRIEIIVNSYFSIIDGKKVYNKGRTVSWVVDAEEYGVTDLEKDIAPYFTWARNQKPNFWVVDSRLNATCRLATDGQLLDLLRGSQVVKLFMVVGARGERTSTAANEVGEDIALNMIQEKMYTRKEIAKRLEGIILPSVLHELNMKSRALHYDIQKSGPISAEISGTTKEGKTWRYAVDLEKRECGCGQWEVSGKPCPHALYLLGKVRLLKTEDFVHDYYSVERFKMAYQFEIAPMNGRSEWPNVDVGFEIIPPPLQRAAGRPRKQRIKASGEPGKRGQYQCKRCYQFGHIEKGCNATQAELEQELPPPRPKKGKKPRKTKSEDGEASTKVVEPSLMPHSSPSGRTAAISPTSQGVTIGRMTSLSPTSPCVTTRSMAAISPGGINRRLIIE